MSPELEYIYVNCFSRKTYVGYIHVYNAKLLTYWHKGYL